MDNQTQTHFIKLIRGESGHQFPVIEFLCNPKLFPLIGKIFCFLLVNKLNVENKDLISIHFSCIIQPGQFTAQGQSLEPNDERMNLFRLLNSFI